MGNSRSSQPPDTNDILIQSFNLDADADYCSLPICYPGKQAMFHTPRNFSSHLSNFIPYEEGKKLIENINNILLDTAFPSKQCNPCFLLCMVSSVLFVFMFTGNTIASVGEEGDLGVFGKNILSIPLMMLSMFFPYFIYFGLFLYKKSARKSQLLAFVTEWNEEKSNGIFLSLGGGGNVRGVNVGSETGGNYEHFYMATWDPKSLLVRGYLHVFVNYQDRANWCQRNGVPFVAPVPIHQQTTDHQIAQQVLAPPAGFQAVAPPAGFQVPAGYALVPTQFQVPAGFALVPESQDMPPNYDQANKM